MNGTLGGLLAQAGFPRTNETDLWRRAILLHNAGAVPQPDSGGTATAVSRGFHLLLLDKRDSPSHFAKCRTAEDRVFERESRLLSVLSRDPTLGSILPLSGSASSETMRVLVSVWVAGDTFERVGPGLSSREWYSAARSILTAADLVSQRAEVLLPDLLTGDSELTPGEELARQLTSLAAAGVDRSTVEPIANALQQAPRLPRHLQHGDLWPGNVVGWNGSWWLLDFEAYGKVQFPLFDVYQLLRSSPIVGHAVPATQAGVAGPAGWDPGRFELLRHFASQLELTPEQTAAAYLCYLVAMTSRLHRTDDANSYGLPYLEELRQAAAALQGGVGLGNLVPLAQ